jgi:hypothetical protein
LSKDNREKAKSVTKWIMRQEADSHQKGLENFFLEYDKDAVGGTSEESGGIVRSSTES